MSIMSVIRDQGAQTLQLQVQLHVQLQVQIQLQLQVYSIRNIIGSIFKIFASFTFFKQIS